MKRMKNKLVLTLAAALLLTLAACGKGKGSDPTLSGPFAGMETVDLQGNAVDSSVFAGKKLTLVNAWNLGCSACIQEIPALDRLNSDLAKDDIAVMGLYYNFGQELSQQDRDDIAYLLERANASYPHLLTSEAMMESEELKSMAVFPMTFFVDENGAVVDSIPGSADYEGWLERIENALEKVEAND